MGRRYSFELVYPIERLPAAVDAIERILPLSRGRRRRERGPGTDPRGLSPDAPLFIETSVLFPADGRVRAFYPLDDVDSEWEDDGTECLPVGVIDLAIRVGEAHALVSFAARTSSMSDLFRESKSVWQRFARLLDESGGVAGLFNDWSGSKRYRLLPDGVSEIELEFFDFVLEERETYWHIDTDRYARAILERQAEARERD